MTVPVATLAGIPLEALDTVGWRLTQGVTPYQRTFEMHKDRAKAILARAKGEVDLFIGGRRPLLIQGLSILSLSSAKHPQRVSVLTTDKRYFADRILVCRRYNMRRRSGERRLVEGNLERITSLPDVTFAKYSLRNERTPWTAEEVIKDVLNEVAGPRGWSEGKVKWEKLKQLDVDGLELADDGQTAIKKALEYVPSLSIYMSKAGLWTLTLTTGGEEDEQLANAPPPVVGPDLPIDVDMSRTRPSSIELYFQPEDECRFDFLDGISATGAGPREPRILRNVLPLPDRKLTIAGKVVVQNTWVEINQALLDAWNSDPDNPATVTIGGRAKTLPPISFEIIRKLWLRPGGYHAWYEIQAGFGNSAWARRWNALYRHYRQTFQVDRRWRDRIRFARAERVAIVDPENARRAPADVFADHCVIPSVKRIAFAAGDITKKLGVNKYAWDDVKDPNRFLKDGHVAETALLVPLDEDQLVYHAAFQPDQEGNTAQILPCLMSRKTDGGPVDIPEADPRPAFARSLFLLGLAQISPKHRFTTVITVSPGSPQGRKGLYKVVVKPEEAKALLPDAVSKMIGECNGPPFQMFVAPGVFPASFAWRDEEAADIEGAILDGKPRPAARLVYPDHVKNVARSMAAITYALFADRKQGTHVGDLDPEAAPVGRIASVIHELGRRGVLLTRRDMPPSVKALSFRSLLPDDTRRLLGKIQV